MSLDEGDSISLSRSMTEPPFHVCGYDRVAFVDTGHDPNKFKCNLCDFILRQPCQGVCGHRFCRRGVDKRLENSDSFLCPQCEHEGEEDHEVKYIKEVYPDNAIKRDLNKQKVRCLIQNCTWIGVFKGYEKHDAECPYKLVKCPQCSQDVPRGQLEDHETTDCPMRSSSCGACSEIIQTLSNKVQGLNEKVDRMGSNNPGSSNNQVKMLESKTKTLASLCNVYQREIRKNQETISSLERQRRLDRELLDAMEKKFRDLERTVSMSDINLKEVEHRISSMENVSYDGRYLWKLTDFARKRQDAIEGRTTSLYSEPFYTHKTGYRMCVRLYLNGDGLGKGTHLSLFFVLMRGPCDSLLPWPFRQKVTFKFVDQNHSEHQVDCFRPDPTSTSFKRPTSDMNIASGCPLFMPLAHLDSNQHAFVRDDTAFIHITVDTSGIDTL